MSLFREQALAAQQTKWLGEIVLIRPLSFSVLTAFSVVLALAVCTFLAWGSYTRHSTVSGQLIPVTGLIKVYAPQSGIVIERHVAEGRQVRRGELLYVLSSDRQSSALGPTQAVISAQVEQRQASLRDAMRKTRLLQQMEYRGLNNRIAGFDDELGELDRQIAGQHERVRLAAETAARYQGLLRQEYISQEQFQQKQEDQLDQTTRMQSLERDRMNVARQRADQQTELAGLALKHQNQLADMERTLAGANQELAESEAKRRIVVTAPASGTATAAIADAGQSVDASRPLVSIVPAGAVLRAELYAPSRAVGFIRPGDSVMIRYQAYPYQKFGHQQGIVASMAQATLSDSELNAFGAANGKQAGIAGGSSGEPMYRIIVDLKSQRIRAYGTDRPLQAGLLLDAEVQQEKLRLYEWVLEPLYNLTGKF
jgi:membrane fusion protein